jgi:hypothetical protein
VQLGGLGQLKKIHLIRTQTCDVPACIIVPQPTTLLCALFKTPVPSFVWPIQPPVQRVRGMISLGIKQQDVKLTTHLHLVPRSRTVELYLKLPPYVFTAQCLINLPLPYHPLPSVSCAKKFQYEQIVPTRI